MKLSVVIAAYDESATVEALVRRLDRTLRALEGVDWELIFVVEGRDGTRELLEGLRAEVPQIRVLYRERPTGLGDAFRRGFAEVAADRDYVVTLDADLNHQPEDVPALLEAARDGGWDVVVGSRFVEGGVVEGTPLWKRSLSGSVNRLMGALFGLRVRDKTSGFRVYRREVLRRVDFESRGFAFLPELLIGARRAGFRICERPIRFVYRREGESKMAFGETSRSYLRLLLRRFDRWSWAALFLLAAALGVRVALSFPVHKFPADADCALNGLCALGVLRGEAPVFFSYVRIGSLGCHLTALLFLLLGVGRTALALGPLLVGSLLVGVWYLFYRELLGRRQALWALVFVAFPAPAVLFWLYMPNGYPETLLFCAAVLWLAARLDRLPESRPTALGLGLAAGLGWWNSLQTLGCTVPAILWLIWRRRRLPEARQVGLAAFGFVAGALPWLGFNLRHPLASLRQTSAVQPVASFEAFFDNLRYLLGYNLPELLASTGPAPAAMVASDLQRSLAVLVLALYAVASLLVIPWGARRDARVLFFLVVVVAASLSLFSAAGAARALTVRYVLPIYLVFPGVLAVCLARLGGRSRLLALSLAAILVFFNLAGAHWPWTEARQDWSRKMEADARLMRLLEDERIDVVVGGYWQVYAINFLSRERVRAIPVMPSHDHYGIAERLPPRPSRWALLTPFPLRLREWARAAGVTGREVDVGYRHRLLLIDEDSVRHSPEAFLGHLRESAPPMTRRRAPAR